jgi:hypothetical protein
MPDNETAFLEFKTANLATLLNYRKFWAAVRAIVLDPTSALRTEYVGGPFHFVVQSSVLIAGLHLGFSKLVNQFMGADPAVVYVQEAIKLFEE